MLNDGGNTTELTLIGQACQHASDESYDETNGAKGGQCRSKMCQFQRTSERMQVERTHGLGTKRMKNEKEPDNERQCNVVNKSAFQEITQATYQTSFSTIQLGDISVLSTIFQLVLIFVFLSRRVAVVGFFSRGERKNSEAAFH